MKAILFFLLISLSAPLQSAGGTSAPNHSEWNTLLQRYVSSTGQVNYLGIKSDQLFKDYLLMLEGTHPDDTWTINDKKAYWINAYNAFTIELITQNMPITSINELDKPWDTQFIKIEGESYSLNDIEHKILRPKFKDPRVHFAINCASKSCPPLSNMAFTSSSLDAQLEKVTKKFINNSQFNSIASDKVELSQIFEWFEDDFAAKGGVISFLNRYFKVPINSEATVSYKAYDWSLNGN